MAGRSSKNKGKQGEREVADIIFYGTGFKLTRNLEQTRGGGHDLNGFKNISIEVKRQETLCLPAWWRQTLKQAQDLDSIPVLAYRKNRQPWQFLVTEQKIAMNQQIFIQWLKIHAIVDEK